VDYRQALSPNRPRRLGVPRDDGGYHRSPRPASVGCAAVGVKVRYLVGKVQKGIENLKQMCYNGK
jgi:hypothetical protein